VLDLNVCCSGDPRGRHLVAGRGNRPYKEPYGGYDCQTKYDINKVGGVAVDDAPDWVTEALLISTALL
jgi:hypothetical protein